MRKINIVSVLLFSFFIAGCQNTGSTAIKKTEQHNIPDYIPTTEDILERHGEIENKERLKDFLNHVEKGQKDRIRVVRYTVEGDPILHDLDYDGVVIKSTKDKRRDKFGVGSVEDTTCTSIEMVEATERTDYNLVGCENQIDNTVLVIWK